MYASSEHFEVKMTSLFHSQVGNTIIQWTTGSQSGRENYEDGRVEKWGVAESLMGGNVKKWCCWHTTSLIEWPLSSYMYRHEVHPKTWDICLQISHPLNLTGQKMESNVVTGKGMTSMEHGSSLLWNGPSKVHHGKNLDFLIQREKHFSIQVHGDPLSLIKGGEVQIQTAIQLGAVDLQVMRSNNDIESRTSQVWSMLSLGYCHLKVFHSEIPYFTLSLSLIWPLVRCLNVDIMSCQ